MAKYVGKRLLYGLITCFILLIFVFFMTRLSGDPALWLIPPRAGETVRAQIMAKYGLDKSLMSQFWAYLKNVVRFDFGDSFYFKRPALDVILEHIPATIRLTMSGLALACAVGIPIGIYSAKNRDTALDYVSRGLAFFAVSAPGFWVGIILVWVFSLKLGVLPSGGSTAPNALILPMVTGSITMIGSIIRLTRSSMLEALGSDYVKLARAKGCSERRVLWVHAFKNASTAVLTSILLMLASIISGDVVLEQVFSWPGAGRLIMQAVGNRDYPLIQCFTLLTGALFVLVSILADILYAVLDPKIRDFN